MGTFSNPQHEHLGISYWSCPLGFEGRGSESVVIDGRQQGFRVGIRRGVGPVLNIGGRVMKWQGIVEIWVWSGNAWNIWVSATHYSFP